jgi:hypothetical protein
MKYLLGLFLIYLSNYSFGQTSTFVFVVKKCNNLEIPNLKKNETKIVAVPIVRVEKGMYISIPKCELTTDKKSILECVNSNKLLMRILDSKQNLYVLNNGKNIGSVKIIDWTTYGFSDFKTFTAIISLDPEVKLLTNNSLIGFNELKIIKSYPILEKRKDPDGNYCKDILLSKVDLDGDNTPELIYLSTDYEGHFYQIFSFKDNNWKKVFEGGYQGF